MTLFYFSTRGHQTLNQTEQALVIHCDCCYWLTLQKLTKNTLSCTHVAQTPGITDLLLFSGVISLPVSEGKFASLHFNSFKMWRWGSNWDQTLLLYNSNSICLSHVWTLLFICWCLSPRGHTAKTRNELKGTAWQSGKIHTFAFFRHKIAKCSKLW